MATFIVEGGHRLEGTLRTQGAKNEALEVICATLLTAEKVTISNLPDILDVRNLVGLLSDMGVKVKYHSADTCEFQADDVDLSYIESEEFCRRAAALRGSVMIIGPLLTRLRRAMLPKPGGDKIGRRRLDTHFLGLMALGGSFDYNPEQRRYNITRGDRLRGRYMLLDEASITGTANLIMAAVLAEGKTTIYNAACEPYIQQLCRMLVRMGAKIEGIGSNLLTIHGVDELRGTDHRCLPDMIEVGSFIGWAARHDICIDQREIYEIDTFIDGSIMTFADAPWPGLSPDLLSIFLVVATQAKGSVLIHQKMFESRLFFVDKLIDMGARIILCDPHRAAVIGSGKFNSLRATEMVSPDIRAGIAMLIAALGARGTSKIHNIDQIDRGYEHIEQRLNSIGAHIIRMD